MMRLNIKKAVENIYQKSKKHPHFMISENDLVCNLYAEIRKQMRKRKDYCLSTEFSCRATDSRYDIVLVSQKEIEKDYVDEYNDIKKFNVIFELKYYGNKGKKKDLIDEANYLLDAKKKKICNKLYLIVFQKKTSRGGLCIKDISKIKMRLKNKGVILFYKVID